MTDDRRRKKKEERRKKKDRKERKERKERKKRKEKRKRKESRQKSRCKGRFRALASSTQEGVGGDISGAPLVRDSFSCGAGVFGDTLRWRKVLPAEVEHW